MKKNILLICAMFMLTGCTKTLKCTNTSDSSNIKIEQNYIIKYDKKNIKNIENKTTYDVKSDSLASNFSMLIGFKKADLENYNIQYDYTEKQNHYEIEYKVNIDELTDEVINELFGAKEINEYKTKMEDNGFKCK